MWSRPFLGAVLCLGTSVAGASPKDYYWQNKGGFLTADRCQISSAKDIPFRITQSSDSDPAAYENIRTYSGAKKHYLLNRSLVRLTGRDAKPKYESIDVIGVSTHPKARVNRWFADRMENGYMHESSLRKLEDYVLELKNNAPEQTLPGLPSVKGTFWQLAVENGRPQVFRCNLDGKMIDHAIFNVFVPDQEEPVARVGVQDDETSIFRSIYTHTTDEADEVIDSRMSKTQEGHNQSLAVSPQGSVPAPAPAPRQAEDSLVTRKQGPAVPLSEPAPAVAAKEEEAPPKAPAEDEGPIRGSNPPSIDESESEVVEDSDEEEEDESLAAVNGAMEYTVCVNEDSLAVRDESLEKILFRADRNETLLPVQSWDSADRKKKTIGGTEYTFIKVQFPERNKKNNTGWLAEPYVRLEGQCPVPREEEEKEEEKAPLSKDQIKSLGTVKNLNSPACCDFPTIKRPTHSYRSGMRRFKAGRSRGRRLHAACDLYRVHGEAAVSIANGTVISSVYRFYQGTYALEIKYPGGFIARYGEITSKVAKGVKNGKSVKSGQTVGYIGTVNSKCCRPMLHFEMYSGSRKGSLSTKGNKFQRRSDLIDPTPYLKKWEKRKFGASY